MHEDWWYPFFVTNWRRDTYHLSAAAKGIYRELIDEYMVSGKPLPDCDSALAGIARVTAHEWGEHREVVRAFFSAKNGKLVHPFYDKYCKRRHPRPSGDKWAELRTMIFVRDDYTCQYCGQRGGRLECDHIKPVSKGGKHVASNLATACFRCNRSKRAKTLTEWRGPQ